MSRNVVFISLSLNLDSKKLSIKIWYRVRALSGLYHWLLVSGALYWGFMIHGAQLFVTVADWGVRVRQIWTRTLFLWGGGGGGACWKKKRVNIDMKVRVHNTLLVSFTNRTSECNEQRVFARDTISIAFLKCDKNLILTIVRWTESFQRDL